MYSFQIYREIKAYPTTKLEAVNSIPKSLLEYIQLNQLSIEMSNELALGLSIYLFFYIGSSKRENDCE